MTTNNVIARLVFWSGLILGTGTAWGQPATEKVQGVDAQLPAVDSLPPASALALEHFYAGRYRVAEPLYRAALAGWERMGAVAERNRIVTAVNLGTLLRAEGRFAEAESVLLDCIRRAEALEPAGSGKSSVEWAHAACGLGSLYLALQQLDKAESFAFQAQAIFNQRLDAGDPERVTNGALLGTVYLEQARYEEAEVQLRATLDHQPHQPLKRVYDRSPTKRAIPSHSCPAMVKIPTPGLTKLLRIKSLYRRDYFLAREHLLNFLPDCSGQEGQKVHPQVIRY